MATNPAVAVPGASRRHHLVINLLENARKYASAGGPAQVSVRAASAGEVEIEVADRGPGIPRALEEKIFERFFRADDAIARGEGGSGLGLSIARALARGMGGDLVFRPRDGGGSRFVLTLPAASS